MGFEPMNAGFADALATSLAVLPLCRALLSNGSPSGSITYTLRKSLMLFR
jgi:hypothetical protein